MLFRKFFTKDTPAKQELPAVNVVLEEDKKLPPQIRATALSTVEMIQELTEEQIANCINHPNLKSELSKRYFVVKDKSVFYKNLTWDDGLLFNINDFTMSLQWELEERPK